MEHPREGGESWELLSVFFFLFDAPSSFACKEQNSASRNDVKSKNVFRSSQKSSWETRDEQQNSIKNFYGKSVELFRKNFVSCYFLISSVWCWYWMFFLSERTCVRRPQLLLFERFSTHFLNLLSATQHFRLFQPFWSSRWHHGLSYRYRKIAQRASLEMFSSISLLISLLSQVFTSLFPPARFMHTWKITESHETFFSSLLFVHKLICVFTTLIASWLLWFQQYIPQICVNFSHHSAG